MAVHKSGCDDVPKALWREEILARKSDPQPDLHSDDDDDDGEMRPAYITSLFPIYRASLVVVVQIEYPYSNTNDTSVRSGAW
jgi:hypothetical protein